MEDELIIQSRENCVIFRFGGLQSECHAVHPKGSIIAIADESDMVSFKLTASRRTLYSWRYDLISPSMGTAEATVEALNAIL